jgi:phosphatidylglycerol:prolipoprotein diacylglycerol transferase
MIEFLPSRAVFLSVFGFSIHWYGMLYLFAFIVALALLPHLQRHRKLFLTNDEWASAVAYAVLGVLIGGRLGYVFFYEPFYFAQHPREIFFVWQGGMASHGGFLGTALALLLFCARYKVNVRRFADVITVPCFIGLGLGRIGNFINQELYGTLTNLPWGMHFAGTEGLRHPIQLYDAAVCFALAIVCYVHLRFFTRKPGKTLALFLMLYGVVRFLLEFIRDQQYPMIDVGAFDLSRGQLLTIPMFLFGALLWVWFSQRREEQDQSQA